MKKIFLAQIKTAVLLFACISGVAQSGLPQLDFPSVPPSPTVASLGEFSLSPIDQYTGAVQYDIPLFTIETGDIVLPISLNYKSNGIRVQQEASWVGLGWNLVAGGQISRVMNGKPDEHAAGYLNIGNRIPDPTDDPLELYSWEPGQDTAGAYATNTWDGQPDIFNFSIPGASSQFVFGFNDEGEPEPYFIPFGRYKLNSSFFTSNSEKWELTTPTGAKYFFGATSDGTREEIEDTSVDEGESMSDYVSSWMLTEIHDPKSNQKVYLHYKDCHERIGYNYGETYYYLDVDEAQCQTSCPSSNTSYSQPILDYDTRKIEEIEFPGGTVEFYSSFSRQDIEGTYDPLQLDSLKVFNSNSDCIKKVVFHYVYQGSTSNFEDCRLILDKVVESDEDETIKKTYEFDYISLSAMSSKDSNSYDHWGYNNGKNGSTISHIVIPESSQPYIQHTSADRTPDPTKSVAGLLEKVTIPTGGYIKYEYEPHDYGFIRNDEVVDYIITDETGEVEAYATVDTARSEDLLNIYTEQFVNVAYTLEDLNSNPEGFQGYVKIVDLQGNEYWSIEDGSIYTSDDQNILLDVGRYKLIAYAGVINNKATATAEYYESSVDSISAAESGGNRVKKVFANDGSINTLITEYKYRCMDDTARSSGILVNSIAQYNSVLEYSSGCNICRYLTFSNRNILPSALTNGSYIAYKDVTKTMAGNGHTRTTFTNPSIYRDQLTNSAPFPPPTSSDWKRGKILKEEQYNNDGDLVASVENEYQIFDSSGDYNRKVIPGIFISYRHKTDLLSSCEWYIEPYEVRSGWMYNNKSTEIHNLDGGDVRIETNYNYSDTLTTFLVSKEVKSSRGDTIKHYYKYPENYNDVSTGDAFAIQLMVDSAFMVGVPIEQDIYINDQLIEAAVAKYDTVSTMILPVEQYRLNSELPVDSSDYILSHTSLANGFEIDSELEKRLVINNYSENGNILELQKPDDIVTSIIWGYDNVHPIAMVQNASIDEVYHTSFEDETSGLSTTSFSGRKVKSLSGAFTIDKEFEPGAYTLMYYWRSDSNSDWELQIEDKTYSSSDLTTSKTSGEIDELRVFPQDAHMTTFCYDPLIGMTSQTDLNGQITHYEYDGLGRLKLVRDNDGNILQEYQYNYAQ